MSRMLSRKEFEDLTTEIRDKHGGVYYSTLTAICRYGQVYGAATDNNKNSYLDFYYNLYIDQYITNQ